MADEDLRSLERAARSGDDASRLAYARALERVGRGDETFRVLLALAHRPEARALLGPTPVWDTLDGGAGRTRSLDVTPVRGPPRVAWLTPRGLTAPTIHHFSEDPQVDRAPSVLFSAHGVTVETRVGTLVLEPTTGSLRFEMPLGWPSAPPTYLAGELAVTGEPRDDHGRALVARELQSGDEVHSFACRPLIDVVAFSGWLFLHEANAVHGIPWPDARSAPVRDDRRAWQQATSLPHSLVGADTVLLMQLERGFRALDAENGDELWRAYGDDARIDALGVVAESTEDELRSRIRAWNPNGRALWTTLFEARIGAVSRDFVVAAITGDHDLPPQWVALERRTGEMRLLGVAPPNGHIRSLAAVARDTAYLIEDPAALEELRHDPLRARSPARPGAGAALVAVSLPTGRVLWTARAPDATAFSSVAVAPSRVVLTTADGRVTCLTDDPFQVVPSEREREVLDARATPGWIAPDGDQGRTRFADVAPIHEPIVEWRRELGVKRGLALLLGNPRGVVAASGPALVALDHATGTERWRAATPDLREAKIVGGVVLAISKRGFVALAFDTGEERHRCAIPNDDLLATPTCVVVVHKNQVSGFSWRNAGEPPESTARWSRAFRTRRRGEVAGLVVSARHIFIAHRDADGEWTTEIDPTTGLIRRSVNDRVVRTDRVGGIGAGEEGDVFESRHEWLGSTSEWVGIPLACSPELVVVRTGPAKIAIGERTPFLEAEPLATIAAPEDAVVALVRGALYVGAADLRAFSARGEELWRVDLGAPIVALAPTVGRLLARTSTGEVVAISDAR